MAVQQNKKSTNKRGNHRAHDFLTNPPLAVEPTTGEVHRRHHISATGFYRGKKVIATDPDRSHLRPTTDGAAIESKDILQSSLRRAFCFSAENLYLCVIRVFCLYSQVLIKVICRS